MTNSTNQKYEFLHKPLLLTFADLTFCLWVVFGFLYERELIGRIALALFCLAAVMLLLFRNGNAFERQNTSLWAINFYFIAYICFLIYVYWHSNFSGLAILEPLAMKMFTTLCINGIFFYLVYKYCVLTDNIENILNLYILAGFITISIILVRTGSGIFSGRLGSVVDTNANSIALLCVNLAVALLYKNSKKPKMYNWLLIVATVFIILITGSRKGVLGLVIGFLVYSLLGGNILKKLKTIALSLIAVVLLYQVVINVEPIYDILGYRVEALISYANGADFEEASLETRDQYIELGKTYIARDPWLGHGLDCFRTLKGAYKTYSHNNYIELLFDVGIIGTAIYYLGYLYILFGHIKLYIKHRINESKLFISLIVTQMFLEYALVTYFARRYCLFLIIALASYRLHINKIKNKGDISC